MSLASVWRARVEARTIVITECQKCGCEHPRSIALLRERVSVGGLGLLYILPCIRCTDSQAEAWRARREYHNGKPAMTQQRVVRTKAPS